MDRGQESYIQFSLEEQLDRLAVFFNSNRYKKMQAPLVIEFFKREHSFEGTLKQIFKASEKDSNYQIVLSLAENRSSLLQFTSQGITGIKWSQALSHWAPLFYKDSDVGFKSEGDLNQLDFTRKINTKKLSGLSLIDSDWGNFSNFEMFTLLDFLDEFTVCVENICTDKAGKEAFGNFKSFQVSMVKNEKLKFKINGSTLEALYDPQYFLDLNSQNIENKLLETL